MPFPGFISRRLLKAREETGGYWAIDEHESEASLGISLKPGETKELTYTFNETGQTFAGCHVAGHYTGGMKAAITVTE